MITVGDQNVAREFYEGVLGLVKTDCPVQDGQRVWYRIGAQKLHINHQKEHRKAGFCHSAIAAPADQYHTYAGKVSRCGYKLSCESQKFGDGTDRIFLDDPFSNTAVNRGAQADSFSSSFAVCYLRR